MQGAEEPLELRAKDTQEKSLTPGAFDEYESSFSYTEQLWDETPHYSRTATLIKTSTDDEGDVVVVQKIAYPQPPTIVVRVF